MDNFDAHKWFKKQYLEEGMSDDNKVVAATEDGEIQITAKQMERLQKGYPVRLSNGSVLASPFVKEGMSDKEFKDAKEAERLEKHPEKDKIKDIQKMMGKEKENQSKSSSLIGRMGDRSLKENMSPGEAVVELNYLMDELQNLSGEVKQIMQQTFPDEYTRGDAYGAFDFGTSSNRYDVTFEGILDNLASVGDDME